MDKYIGTPLKTELNIKRLYSVHYFEFPNDYLFKGEQHDFWEIVYIDKGEAIIRAGEREFVLNQGELVFHKPNEYHGIRSNGKTAPNIAIISFGCTSQAMAFFENKILKVGQNQKDIIAKILTEYTNAFSTPLDMIFTYRLKMKKNVSFGAIQLLKQYICELLISYIRDEKLDSPQTSISTNHRSAIFTMLVNYMLEHTEKNISMTELVKYSGINKNDITKIFNEKTGKSPIDYYIHIKIEAAKKYLRENNYNITQISEILGYASVHYFSRQFKKITGMTPTQYSGSLKAMNEAAVSMGHRK